MRKLKLYRALARATGEPAERLKKMGFSIIRVITVSAIDHRKEERPNREGKPRAS